MAADIICILIFPTPATRRRDPRRQLWHQGFPLAQDEIVEVLGEAHSPFLCLLAVPVPSSLPAPWEPELSVAPQLCHTEHMNLAGQILSFKSNPAAF